MTPADVTRPVVLVVDDEQAIREAVRDILELVNADTLLAANGHEGLALYQANHERIRLIILDLRMPIMSGVETYHALRAHGATVPIVLSSGYDDKISGIDFDADAQLSLLRKPYALDALLATVESAIDG